MIMCKFNAAMTMTKLSMILPQGMYVPTKFQNIWNNVLSVIPQMILPDLYDQKNKISLKK